MIKHLQLLILLLLFSSVVIAQRQLTGIVRDAKTGSALPAATVKLQGSNVQVISGSDGTFTLNIPAGSAVLEVSYVGFGTKTVPVAPGENDIIIALDETTAELTQVVVTALGISKEQRKLGYSVTTVSGEQMNRARETNLALSLSGRVAGLNVKGTSSGPGGTAKILLRGMPSMNSAGSPLFVINGVPIDNTQRGSAGEWGGADNGDGIGNLNPDDIETMTVLKGQSASALYGARASNGVILITTKSGRKGAFAIDYNINYMVDDPMDLTDFQYVYGQGIGGKKPATVSEALQSGRMSWGERLDGSQVIQFDGKTYPYTAAKDNLEDFYRTGSSFTNTIALSRGGENGSFRLSLSNLDNKSIVRNSGLERKSINLNADQKITDKLNISILANYINEQSDNRPQLSDGPMNPNNGLFLATNINQEILAPGYDPVTGFETRWSDDEFVTNPWFVVNQYINDLGRKRLISAITTRYDFTKWLYAQARVGYDLQNDRLFRVEPWGTAYTTERRGNLQDLASIQTYELNVDGLVGVTRKLTTDLNLDVTVGANLRKNQSERVKIGGGPFILPYFYSWNNVRNFNRDYTFFKTEVQSAFYTMDFTYKNFLTLNTTGRYDTYSTLPSNNRDIFTPSVSASLVYSELIDIPALNFGKLRVSYANTSGEPGEAYRTAVYYSLGNSLNGVPVGSFSTDLPNLTLKPFTLNEIEIGTEVRLLRNRLGFDIAFYTRKTENEIMPTTLSAATGFTSGLVGTGSTRNTGLELQITGVPIQQNDFRWNITANLTTVKNKILETDPEGKNQNLGQNRATLGNAITAFVKDFAGPQILAYDYRRHANGEIIVDANGYPLRGELIKMGSVLPKLYGGVNNEFNYKNFSFAFLIDYNYGNKVLSATNYYSIFRGLHKMTLEGREGGITVGVREDGSKNTTPADAQGYYRSLAQNVTSIHVLDGDFIKLRQATLSYTFPERTMENIPLFQSIQLSLVGRNLLILMKNTENIDPEATFGSNIRYQGIEGTSLPSTRTFGINANFKFKNNK